MSDSNFVNMLFAYTGKSNTTEVYAKNKNLNVSCMCYSQVG
jgi:hypothetical protein